MNDTTMLHLLHIIKYKECYHACFADYHIPTNLNNLEDTWIKTKCDCTLLMNCHYRAYPDGDHRCLMDEEINTAMVKYI